MLKCLPTIRALSNLVRADKLHFNCFSSVGFGKTVSDLFVWRVGDEINTSFYLPCLSDLFRQPIVALNLTVFDDHGIQIDSLVIEANSTGNFYFDFSALDISGIGTFAVEFEAKNIDNEKAGDVFINRGYVGYRRGNVESFCHGNNFAIYRGKSGWTSMLFRNYLAQTFYCPARLEWFDSCDVVVTNPTKSPVAFEINQSRVIVQSLGCKSVCFDNIEFAVIKSKLSFPRPIIFGYKGDFMDVFHG